MKFDSLDSNFACARFHQVPSNRILTKLTLRFHSCSLSVHCEFSRIVCVSLFSYQGLFCLSLRQLVYFITFISACQVLFSSFFEAFLMFVCRSQATCLLYHILTGLSTTFFAFFKTFQIVYSEETILRDSSVRITLSNRAVNTFFEKS